MFEHCGRINCICTHTGGCVKGFIDTRYVDRKEVIRNGEKKVVETWYDGVLFCPTCDPERAYIQNTSRTSEEMAKRLRERSSFKQEETYKNNESSKTRTL